MKTTWEQLHREDELLAYIKENIGRHEIHLDNLAMHFGYGVSLEWRWLNGRVIIHVETINEEGDVVAVKEHIFRPDECDLDNMDLLSFALPPTVK